MAEEKLNAAPQQPELSVEQLKNVANRLGAENEYLKNQATAMQAKIMELSDFSIFKRLEFLFKVVESAGKVAWPEDFVLNCTNEIVECMSIPEQPAEEKEDANDGQA